jgi:hypothetical protein
VLVCFRQTSRAHTMHKYISVDKLRSHLISLCVRVCVMVSVSVGRRRALSPRLPKHVHTINALCTPAKTLGLLRRALASQRAPVKTFGRLLPTHASSALRSKRAVFRGTLSSALRSRLRAFSDARWLPSALRSRPSGTFFRRTLLARPGRDFGRRLPRHAFQRAPVKTSGLLRRALASQRAPVEPFLTPSSEARFPARSRQDFRLRPLVDHSGERKAAAGPFAALAEARVHHQRAPAKISATTTRHYPRSVRLELRQVLRGSTR